MPKVKQVIESTDHRGRGIGEDPHRLVVQIHELDGTFIMEHDEWMDENLSGCKRNAYIAVNGARLELNAANPRMELVKKFLWAAMRCLEGVNTDVPSSDGT